MHILDQRPLSLYRHVYEKVHKRFNQIRHVETCVKLLSRKYMCGYTHIHICICVCIHGHTPMRTPTYPASHANTHPSVHRSLRSLKSRWSILHTTSEKLPKAQLLMHRHDYTMKIPCHEASFHA